MVDRDAGETTGEVDHVDELQLGPSTTASRVRDSVLIEERRGNLVKRIFIDKDDYQKIGSLFDQEVRDAE